MKQTLLTLLLCLPVLAIGQIDTTTKNPTVYSPLKMNLVTGAVWHTTNAVDRKINTTLVQDMPYNQFALQVDTHKAYNLSSGTQPNTKTTLISSQQSQRDLVELKPINYFYGQFKMSE